MRIAALVILTLATLVSGVTARPLAATFERLLKQPVVVVNKAGAAGAVGAQFASVAKPDGYTLLIALVSISSTPEVDKLFGRPATCTRDQFVEIARLNADPPVAYQDAEEFKAFWDADARRIASVVQFIGKTEAK